MKKIVFLPLKLKWDKTQIYRGLIDGNIRYHGDAVLSGPIQRWEEQRMYVVSDVKAQKDEFGFNGSDVVKGEGFKVVAASDIKGLLELTPVKLRKLRWINKVCISNSGNMLVLTEVQYKEITK